MVCAPDQALTLYGRKSDIELIDILMGFDHIFISHHRTVSYRF